MQIIGIDIGTTSICGVAVDAKSGRVLKSKTVDSNAFLSGKPFEKIQSVDKIITTAFTILEDLICADTASIGVTGQMHGIVYVDTFGNAVSPLYTWQDERGNEPYKSTTYAAYLGSCSGYGNVTDFYNRENRIRPENAVSYCTIHDYLVMKLCGLDAPIIHSTDAASFGLYDIVQNKFSYNVNAEITNDYTLAGRYKNIPVGVAIGDNQASVFSTLTSENDILLNVGTGSQVSVISDVPIMLDNIEARPYFDNKYLIVGSALCGGRAYSLLKDFYKKLLSYFGDFDSSEIYLAMDKMAEAEQCRELLVDTRFAGTRKDPSVSGSISGIGVDNFTPEAFSRGVLKGMVNELKGMYSQMGTKGQRLIGSGNGIRKNKQLIKIAEIEFGLPLLTPKHCEEAAVGAALFGGICAGIYASSQETASLIRYKK